MTGWICFAMLLAFLLGAGVVFAWGVWLSRKNMRKLGVMK